MVKDDSAAYAVFTEQGSSASQTTAAKEMDVVAGLPGCAGRAADAVISLHPGKNGRCTIFIEIYRLNVQMYGYVFHGINIPNDGQTSKAWWFFSNETCADIHLLASSD